MATVSFKVPNEVKAAFDKVFGDQNKNAGVADLMRRAVRERHVQIRRERLFRQLSEARANWPRVSYADIRRARTADRP